MLLILIGRRSVGAKAQNYLRFGREIKGNKKMFPSYAQSKKNNKEVECLLYGKKRNTLISKAKLAQNLLCLCLQPEGKIAQPSVSRIKETMRGVCVLLLNKGKQVVQ